MALKYNIVKTKQYKRDCKAAMKSGCTAEAAESIRARLEVEADRAHFRKTGKHLLPVVSARDLERHPELAVQDIVRPKLTEWKPEDSLKTPEAQKEFLAAAVEDGNPAFIAQSLAVVMRARGLPNIGALLDVAANICEEEDKSRPKARRCRTAKRELARA